MIECQCSIPDFVLWDTAQVESVTCAICGGCPDSGQQIFIRSRRFTEQPPDTLAVIAEIPELESPQVPTGAPLTSSDGSPAIGSASQFIRPRVDHGFETEWLASNEYRLTQENAALTSSLTALRGTLDQARAIEEGVEMALTGDEPSDFLLSFSLVRCAFDLRQALTALRGALENVRATNRAYHCWCDSSYDTAKYGHQLKCEAASTALAVSRVPHQHQWKTQRAGGHPADADSAERVTFCEACGLEQSEDNQNDTCAVSRVHMGVTTIER